MTGNKREFGDWQTPVVFAEKCCDFIIEHFDFYPDLIVEPTCGVGNFIQAASKAFPNVPILGIEINEDYVKELNDRFKNNETITIIHEDYLRETKTAHIAEGKATLIVGNPPWVTTSTLSTLNSRNSPKKENVRNLRGIDALTGMGNFDICEWIISKALRTVDGNDDLIAMLCKTSVARNICRNLAEKHAHVGCTIANFDGKNVFGINAAACFLLCDFRQTSFSIHERRLDDGKPERSLVYVNGDIYQELPSTVRSLQGQSTLTWRQGVKHDCSRVMELKLFNNSLTNKLGEEANIESDYLYPYVKSSKTRQPITIASTMVIPMTQRRLGEDTSHLSRDAPLLWSYLQKHRDLFAARKSSIYKNAPEFSLFGIGDYAFSPYKVAVSGFYKEPVFTLAKADKPIMFDDTCYYIPFESEDDAKVCMLLLNTILVRNFYKEIAFLDSKRPFTKRILSQLDFSKALDLVGLDGLNSTAEELEIDLRVTTNEMQKFRNLVQCTLF